MTKTTPEGATLETAPLTGRIVGALIELVFIVVVGGLIFGNLIAATIDPYIDGGFAYVLYMALTGLVELGILMIPNNRRRTVGMFVTDMQIADEKTAGEPSIQQLVIRTVLKWVMTTSMVGLALYLALFGNERRQGLHEKLSGTRTIRL